MPLPIGGNVRWPPAGWERVFRAYAEWSAWYSGDPEALADFYGQAEPLLDRTPWWKFWARQRLGKERQPRSQMHVPLAGDIAATSASLLFSEAPDVIVPLAHGESPDAGAKAAEQRALDIFDQSNAHATLLEAAEAAAALGGVYLRVVWDKEQFPYPFLSPVHADAALPEFRWGQLWAVTFWRVVEVTGGRVLRHLERYEPGLILHGLYRGSGERLGEAVELAAHPSTEGLQDQVALPDNALAVRYIPNIRPNRRFRNVAWSALGASDFAGSESLLDALDECWTSWMRDVRVGKARLLVPEEWLEKKDGKLQFDVDQEVFVGLAMEPGQENTGITENQFAIRFEEHSRTAMELMERIIVGAGYSPQSFGLRIEGRAESGTALRIRERKTFMTQQKKRRYWEQPLADLMRLLLVVDAHFLDGKAKPFPVRVDMADSIQPDPREIGESIELLNRAQAASVEVKVRMAHPDWGEEEVQAEAERLRAELGMMLPDLGGPREAT